jgi:anti-sigma regulatory factor (Ser/Thr protein kinase)
MPGEVVVTIPADTQHVALVRAAATALAARMDFSFDRITDLHIAIDEICSRLMAAVAEPEAIEVRLRKDEDRLSIAASAEGERRADRDLFTEWSRVILDAIAQRVDASAVDGRTTFEVELTRTPS